VDVMRLIGIPVPPMLEAALGYPGDSRFVAFWWEQAGDELAWDDGRESTVGANWYAWLIFVQHPSVEPYLAPYLLGNSDEEARHVLLLDRQDRVPHVGGRAEVARFLAEHAPPTPSVTIEDLQTYMREVLPKITEEEIARRPWGASGLPTEPRYSKLQKARFVRQKKPRHGIPLTGGLCSWPTRRITRVFCPFN
jgi:hypothetical protein